MVHGCNSVSMDVPKKLSQARSNYIWVVKPLRIYWNVSGEGKQISAEFVLMAALYSVGPVVSEAICVGRTSATMKLTRSRTNPGEFKGKVNLETSDRDPLMGQRDNPPQVDSNHYGSRPLRSSAVNGPLSAISSRAASTCPQLSHNRTPRTRPSFI